MGQHLQDRQKTPQKMGWHLLKLSDKRQIWDGTFRTPVFWCEKWDGSNRNGIKTRKKWDGIDFWRWGKFWR